MYPSSCDSVAHRARRSASSLRSSSLTFGRRRVRQRPIGRQPDQPAVRRPDRPSPAVGACRRSTAARRSRSSGTENFYADLLSPDRRRRACHATSILNDPNADPHEFESSPADAALAADAKLVIVNGLGYDDFMQKLLGASRTSPTGGHRRPAAARPAGRRQRPHLVRPGDDAEGRRGGDRRALEARPAERGLLRRAASRRISRPSSRSPTRSPTLKAQVRRHADRVHRECRRLPDRRGSASS